MRAGPRPAIWRDVLDRARLCWPSLLVTHLAYGVLGFVLVAPLLAVAQRLLVAIAGEPALTDFDILLFVLSPLGLVLAVAVTAVGIALAALELASLMAIGVAARDGHRLPPLAALLFTLRRVPRILTVAFLLVGRVLLLVTPFLAVAAGIAWLMLSDHDINYYLAERPPAFWLAAGGILLVLLLMGARLLPRLVGWSLVLPLVLFEGTTARGSFAQSEQQTHGTRWRILLTLGAWFGVALALGACVLALIHLLGDLLVPPFAASMSMLVLILGGLAVLWFVLNLIVTALSNGGFALILITLGERLGLSFHQVAAAAGADPAGAGLVTARRLTFALVVGVIAATVVGVALLRSVRLSDDVVVVAHRGAAASAPENTLASVRRAIDDGADWIEIDVQETADGEVVVIHDRDLMKLAGVELNVWEATLADLAEVDVGSSFDPAFAAERVPTLRAVLEEAHGRAGVVIELKYYGHQERLEARVADVVDDLAMATEVRVMSLERAGVQAMQTLRPDWTLGLLAATAIGDLTRLDADFLAVNASLASASFIRNAQDRGKEVWAWTVNDPLEMSRLISLGIDGLITDRPGMARAVLRERAGLSPVERLMLQAAIVFDRPLPGSVRADEAP